MSTLFRNLLSRAALVTAATAAFAGAAHATEAPTLAASPAALSASEVLHGLDATPLSAADADAFDAERFKFHAHFKIFGKPYDLTCPANPRVCSLKPSK